jgi:hypothetical protein
LESRLKLLRLGSRYISVLSCSLMLSYDILALPTWDGSEKKSCRNTTGNTHTNKNRHKQDRWVRHTHTQEGSTLLCAQRMRAYHHRACARDLRNDHPHPPGPPLWPGRTVCNLSTNERLKSLKYIVTPGTAAAYTGKMAQTCQPVSAATIGVLQDNHSAVCSAGTAPDGALVKAAVLQTGEGCPLGTLLRPQKPQLSKRSSC